MGLKVDVTVRPKGASERAVAKFKAVAKKHALDPELEQEVLAIVADAIGSLTNAEPINPTDGITPPPLPGEDPAEKLDDPAQAAEDEGEADTGEDPAAAVDPEATNDEPQGAAMAEGDAAPPFTPASGDNISKPGGEPADEKRKPPFAVDEAPEEKLKAKKAKPFAQRYALKGVEIFKVGEHNGETYTAEDVEWLVASFESGDLGYEVPITLGHIPENTPGAPSSGWIERLYADDTGEVLMADFADMQAPVYEAVKDRKYNHVSSEIYFDLKRNGKSFPRALKAVALLGAETPGVAGLKPLRMAQFGAGAYGKLVNLTVRTDMTKPPNTEADALEVKKLRQELDALRTEASERDERDRQRMIDDKVNELNLPSMREYVRSFYEMATASKTAPKVVKFSVDNGKNFSEVSTVRLIDDFVNAINTGPLSKLFTEVSRGSQHRGAGGDKPGDTVDAGVKALVSSGKAKDYAAGLKMFRQDPANADLLRRYNVERN